MKKTSCYTPLAAALILVFVWIGCGKNVGPFAPGSDPATQSLAKKVSPPGIEVKPVFRVPTGRPDEWLTVFVFHEKGGKGKKPPKDGGGEECSDPNTNQAFSELGVGLPARGFKVKYQPAFEPVVAIGAIDKAFSAWEAAVVGEEAVFDFTENPDGSLPPELDGTNAVGWRLFVGRGGSFLAAAFIWDNGTTILEADIFYNLKHKWAVNPAIESGSTLCGEQFDVQAVGTHEIGHMLGLGHVSSDGDATNGDETDATMFGAAAKGELKKQTLTPGDEVGANTVSPAPSA